MISIRSPIMREINKEFSTDDLSSSLGNICLTDDLADFMKLSILVKCHNIHKDVHNVTIGPNSSMRAAQIPDKKKMWSKTKSIITPATNTKTSSEHCDRPQPRSTRNEAQIMHLKTLQEFESKRQKELKETIERRQQKFSKFDQEQSMEKKLSWHKNQENKIQMMQQQEMHIKKMLEEHNKEVYAKNQKIENHYKQLAEKQIKEEQALNETMQQINVLVQEFSLVYNDVAEEVKKLDASQKGRFVTHIATLDQLNQQLQAIIAKCNTSPLTIQPKDLSKCHEIINLENRIRTQMKDTILPKPQKQNVQTEKVSIFSKQPPKHPIFNVPEPAPPLPVPPPYQPPVITPTPAFVPTPPSTTQQTIPVPTPSFVQSTPPSPPISEPPPQANKVFPKLDKYVNKSLLERYVYLQNLVMQKEQIYKQILEDPSLKTFKNNCKKAVNMPVNTLTDSTPQHLSDKYNKLNSVLSGRTVEISGERINVCQHAHGIDFCMDLLAKKFVLQGDLIVSSNTAISAFNYASVIISLWNDFPVFGELILGHFYRECPYLVPFYPPKVAGQSEEEFCKSQGYRYSNGELEGQDIFLKRMVGFARLYAATLVTSAKQSHNGVSQQSMAIAWQWLASTINLQPRLDITAAMIHTFLETVGYKMQEVFGKQFHKLIAFLTAEYLTKIKNIDTEGPVNRLELLLQDYAKDGTFPEPDGMLPTNFW